MRRTVATAALAVGALAIGAVPALAGTPTGNGAQRSNLSTPSSGSGCQQGGGGANGFAILNKTGAPVPGTSVIQGEVHVVDPALSGQTVMAFVVPSSSSSCMSQPMTMITLNGQGIGNGHLAGAVANGSYFIAIIDKGGNEVLASQSVPLI